MLNNNMLFIKNLLSAISASNLYNIEHNQVKKLIDNCFTSLQNIFLDIEEKIFFIIDDELIIDNIPVPHTVTTQKFIDIINSFSLKHIAIRNDVTLDDLKSFIKIINKKEPMSEMISTISLGYADIAEDTKNSSDMSSGEETAYKDINDISKEQYEKFREVYENIKKAERLKLGWVTDTVNDMLKAYKNEGMSLNILAILRNSTEETFTHSCNVSMLSIIQAESLNFNKTIVRDIGIAGLLHDIGKLYIPKEILLKTTSLNDKEKEIITSHTIKGARYLLGVNNIPKLAAIVAFEHHMSFYDYESYPSISGKWDIHPASQIVAIADTYDAMRSQRTYNKPTDAIETSKKIMELCGKRFEPLYVKNFLAIVSNTLKNI